MNPLENVAKAQVALGRSAAKMVQLKKATDAMEANFLKSMFQAMRKGTKEVHFGSAPGEDTYREMTDDAMADVLASRGTLGVSKLVFKPMAEQVIADEMKNATIASRMQAAALAKKNQESELP